MIVFKTDRKLFGADKDILYIPMYKPPEGSRFYSHFEFNNGINIFEECLVKCMLKYAYVYLIVAEDLNSRISNMNVFNLQDDFGTHSQTWDSHPIIWHKILVSIILENS